MRPEPYSMKSAHNWSLWASGSYYYLQTKILMKPVIECIESVLSNSTNSAIINEVGAAGHMLHPYEYMDFTLRSIKGLVRNVFQNKVESISEKIDGANIQATKAPDGSIRFIRNSSDLKNGGVDMQGIADKWPGKPAIQNTFLTACKIITDVLKKVPEKVFNPKPGVRIFVNCECVNAGRTNIMRYASSHVDFHNIWVYTEIEGKWQVTDVLSCPNAIISALKDIDNASLTPKLIVQVTHESELQMLAKIKEIDAVFKAAGCGEQSTIRDYYHAQFVSLTLKEFPWIQQSKEGMEVMFNRVIENDRKVNIREVCKMYADTGVDASKVRELDAAAKEVKERCMAPLDKFFISFGNAVIKMCKGIMNTGKEADVIEQLGKDLKETVEAIKTSDDMSMTSQLVKQLERIGDEQLNASEGLVFKYHDRMMKLTGTFAPLNMILNLKYHLGK